MKYKIGQVVCLWEVQPPSPESVRRTITIATEILVTITDIRENVLGEFSKEPSGTGLKGIGDNGKEYEKHWDSYPETQLSSFENQWSLRDNGTADKEFPFWYPQEAAPFHSGVARENSRYNTGLKIVDKDGNLIEPKGDLEKCSEHGIFHYPGTKCVQCRLSELRKIPIRLS